MKSFSSVAVALVTLATTALAKQSAPFYLVAISSNDKVNGTYFDACHEGAAFEALCVGGKKPSSTAAYDTYRLNNTNATPNQGALSWLLAGSNFKESEPMTLYVDPSTNVALPMFEPTYDTTYVGFDSSNKLYIPSYVNDRVTPPVSQNAVKLYNWYTCQTYYTGYTYHTLTWVLGTKYPPQNPSCEKVEVVRVFT